MVLIYNSIVWRKRMISTLQLCRKTVEKNDCMGHSSY